MRIATLLQFTTSGELPRSGRGSNAATGEARRGCVAREEPVHLLGRVRREGHMQPAITQLLLHK